MSPGKRKPPEHTALSEESSQPRQPQSLSKDSLMVLHKFTKIGTALSAERKIDSLLEMIVEEAKELTNADGVTLYIMSPDKTQLQFAIVQTDSLHIRMGGKGGEITWPAVPLTDPEGSPNHSHVCAHVALTKRTVNIKDVYEYEGFNFQGTKDFDHNTGYRSRSMLVVPMKNYEDDVIGILQLLNAYEKQKIIAFSSVSAEIAESFASQAAVALSNTFLVQELETLLESFIRAIAFTIDEKSPYTGGHVRRVTEMTMKIAYKINEKQEGPFSDVRFSDDELKELQISAWLHDVGKITIPEHIIDKATKLQTIYDRMEIIKIRFELYKRNALLAKLGRDRLPASESFPEQEELEKTLRDEFHFLVDLNEGNRPVSKETAARIRQIGMRKFEMEGKMRPLLLPEEIENLSIPEGTLTPKERSIIENHAEMTYRILSQLPFPEKIKHVPQYAASHHERPNGMGYPKGLAGEQIPLQAKIIALADSFDALMAGDRPYKRAKTVSEAMDIMEEMAKDLSVDPDLFELFKKERFYLKYNRTKSKKG